MLRGDWLNLPIKIGVYDNDKFGREELLPTYPGLKGSRLGMTPLC